jgi:Arc/MetJ-type ribon-helix-helix transcriptional regulator
VAISRICIPKRYAECMTVQLVVRIPNDLADAVDELVGAGVYGSRSEAVRAALDVVVDRERRARVGEAIVEGYRKTPQEQDELSWPDTASAAMIAEEPW